MSDQALTPTSWGWVWRGPTRTTAFVGKLHGGTVLRSAVVPLVMSVALLAMVATAEPTAISIAIRLLFALMLTVTLWRTAEMRSLRNIERYRVEPGSGLEMLLEAVARPEVADVADAAALRLLTSGIEAPVSLVQEILEVAELTATVPEPSKADAIAALLAVAHDMPTTPEAVREVSINLSAMASALSKVALRQGAIDTWADAVSQEFRDQDALEVEAEQVSVARDELARATERIEGDAEALGVELD